MMSRRTPASYLNAAECFEYQWALPEAKFIDASSMRLIVLAASIDACACTFERLDERERLHYALE